MDTAFDAYLDGAGEEVAAWLANIKGGSTVVCNRGAKDTAASCVRIALERAAAVAGHASQLAPPKPHRKAARRERQQALRAAAARTEGRVADAERSAAVGGGGGAFDDLFAVFSWSSFVGWFNSATSGLAGDSMRVQSRGPASEHDERNDLLPRDSQHSGTRSAHHAQSMSLPPV